MPLAISFDLGGALSWTRYIAALAVLAVSTTLSAAVIANSVIQRTKSVDADRRDNTLIITAVPPTPVVLISVLMCGFAAMQLTPVSDQLLKFLSPGSSAVYSDWIAPFGFSESEIRPVISVNPGRTLSALATVALAAATMLIVSQLKFSIWHLTVGLSAIAIGTFLHSCYGILFTPVPDSDVNALQFGGFYNRNNGALFINIGVAASIGLLVSRLLSPAMGNRGKRWQFDFLESLQDPFVCIALVSLGTNILALFLCGSRGGLISSIAGIIAVSIWAFQRHSTTKLLGVLVAPLVLGLGVALMLGGNAKSLSRASKLNPRAVVEGLSGETRLQHWADAMDAAKAYLPLGGGVGTYREAYLPYQQKGPNQTFANADNLYLELIVEAGIGGVAFVLILSTVAGIALYRLHRSSDPIDLALSATGAYLVASIAISQITDFGLLLPANMLLSGALFAIIVHRSCTTKRLKQNANRKDLFAIYRANSNWIVMSSWAILPVLLTSGAVSVLHKNATDDALYFAGLARFKSDRYDFDKLCDAADSFAKQSPERNFNLSLLASKYNFAEGRFRDILSQNPTTEKQLAEAIEASSPGRRTLEEVSLDASENYLAAKHFALIALQQNPLSVDARVQLLQTDFIADDDDLGSQMISQLARLQSQNGPFLMELANYALHRGDIAEAQQLAIQATTVRPVLARDFVTVAANDSRFNLCDAISDRAPAKRLAAQALLNRASTEVGRFPNGDEFLSHYIDQFDQHTYTNSDQRAESLREACWACLLLGRTSEAVEFGMEAIKYAPGKHDFYVTVSSWFFEHGELEHAKAFAELGLAEFPSDEKLLKLLVTIDSAR
ncbi:O-antigen ligase family protein [Stieleria sp. JC731]|uniref:O-antigen ligase family protein n=1 Tax=Pirellulaceae TaxID=2691357 RepID=UPI001E2E7A61|nr:O-antigen ligase family protein [Stieleria sp. JC731]MCC9601107.1 O-antigen ligase family protein [Stieleria sp. JC731]